MRFVRGDLEAEDWQQMLLMSGCDHNIIANSSFSWWSAYLNENQNQLLVTMNTYNNSDTLMDQIVVNDIPMNKWFNIIIRVKNKRLDVYINGTIKRAFELEGVPKQNYGDIFVAQGSNLQSSKLSNLRYYDYALNVSDIQKMVKKGANKTLITKNAMSDSSSSYLAFDWYYN